MSQATRWCFTLNNFVPEDEVTMANCGFVYLIYGHEIAPATGTPHLQGYVTFKNSKRLTAMKKIHPRAHWLVAKGTSEENKTYCSKGSNIVEKGSCPSSGKRSDLEDFKDAVKEGEFNAKRLREDFSEVCAKYPRFVNEYIRDNLPDPPLEAHPLFEWQQKLNHQLLLPPNDRSVTFVVDHAGNRGKSWFAKYYCSLHENACYMRPGKHADMAYALPPTLRVLFLDCTRKQLEYLPYTFMEELKDGLVMSSKYESCVKRYGPVHVVVLLNQDPDMTALSTDRYDVIDLN